MMASIASDAHILAQALNSAPGAFIATDAQGLVTFVNPAAEKLFSVSANLVMGQPLRTLHAALGEHLDRALTEGGAQPLHFEMEIGAQVNAVSLTPVPAEGGARAAWVVTSQDVTRLRKLEQWKSEALDTFAHDVRNPLNVIIGSLNLLRDILAEPAPEEKECLSMIQYNAERVMALAEGLLEAERAESGEDLKLALLALRSVIRDVVEDFRMSAQEKGVRLEFVAPLVDVEILGDEVWLHRAAGNLVSNAIKYAPAGGRVLVTCREADGQGLVEVTDTGPGIPPEAQARLFQRFYRVRTEATRRAAGTGLGLAIVKSIVERHGGRVWVSTEAGKGSTFGFSVPLAS